MSTINDLDILAVRNIIALSCEALDTKDFALLKKVFVENVSADYPFNHDLQDVNSIITAVQNRLGPIRTHHNLTTQRITFDDNGKTAHAVTYFQSAHFGQGPHEGKLLCAYGKYFDDLELQQGSDGKSEGVPGASGIWRIVKRKVTFTQRIGDEKIMSEH
ncbi:hypothetical protein E8E13_006815 [Curvularia kusanoi]|uniref:SnoaL-like domain-containing protein n=1 Tax=Curvularia kusanoi TaxID=90978 RepID=A0A9P4WCW3_CURKU|nr:hypothetical protein E8E13_006815 [Curvularia kusanoi]